MSDHANVIREALRDFDDVGSCDCGGVHNCDHCIVQDALAALDALVAERESWIATAKAMQAERDEARQMCDDAVNHLRVRAEAAEAERDEALRDAARWCDECNAAEARVTALEAEIATLKEGLA